MTASPIKSVAQHRMFTRASTDADYAKERGITQDAARAALDAHKAAGEPALPERAGTKPAPARTSRGHTTRPWWERR